MDYLYHYCSNEKCFSILNNKVLRLSDIQKSNDYNEMRMFFPEFFDIIEELYKEKPFPISYNGLNDLDAIVEMTRKSYNLWKNGLYNGRFSNFVVCFSEKPDSLSQWRGYADNGKGCCIGFSKQLLLDYCERNKNVLSMEKVHYSSKEEIEKKIRTIALSCLKNLKKWQDESCADKVDNDKRFYSYFSGYIHGVITASLCVKSEAFSEEKEWRIFLKYGIDKEAEWIYRDDEEGICPEYDSDTMKFLHNNIQFRVTDNDIIPFCPIRFEDFTHNPVEELWMGPKSIIRPKDIELFLHQNGYGKTKPIYSHITYC